MIKFNGHSETGKIISVLVKTPQAAWLSQENIDCQWEKLHYPGRPEYHKALAEYDCFISLLQKHVANIYYLLENEETGLDSIYPRDPVLLTREGAILCRMGKPQRRGEPAAAGARLAELGIPVLGEISAPGTLEGGDVVWLDEKTVAVGLSYRSNAEGVRQFRELTKGLVEQVIEVPLPHWNGAGECLHLMSIFSPVDRDLAVVYSRLMAVPFRNYLLERGIRLVEVPDEEYDTFACNVLAVAPRCCIMLAGNPRTRVALEKEGARVYEYPGHEISLKGGGGPTCLTRPLWRNGP